MLIREIEKQDDPAMAEIIKRSLESFGLDIPGTAYFDPQLEHLSEYYKTVPNGSYWVAVVAGKVVGGVGIGPFDGYEGISELQKLYIKPAAQGKGYSRELLEQALAFAQKHYHSCYIETMGKLSVANVLYEKVGFERLQEPLTGSEHGTMDTWYLKKLD